MQPAFESIVCSRLHTPENELRDVAVEFDGALIRAVRPIGEAPVSAHSFDATGEGLVVVPGLIDTHIHGSGGADFLDRKAESVDLIREMAARGGATSIVATTTIPTDDEDFESFAEFVRLVRESMRQTAPGSGPQSGARILGIFLEGPYLNMEKRGGFGTRFVHPVDLKKAERILDLCADILLKITISPEIEGAEDLIHLLLNDSRSRVEISLGHTDADYEMGQRFFAMERVRQVTHAFNAMSPFHHRTPNLIGAALLDDNVLVEMVTDGFHLTGPAIELMYRIKGPKRAVIVTDGTAATATEPGTRVKSVGGWTQIVDGVVRLDDGTIAGSALQMASAMKATIEMGHVPFDAALRMASLTPAESVHHEHMTGAIKPGLRADFCVLRNDGTVHTTIRDGQKI